MIEKPNAHLDIVFVHGLGSSSQKAWINEEANFNWPEEMNKPDNLASIAVDYAAPIRKVDDAGAVRASWQEAGNLLLDDLASREIGKRPVVFVAHSLGGIVVKQALRIASADENPLYKNTQAVFFLATPHAGASIANIASILAELIPGVGNLAARLAGLAGGVEYLAYGVGWLAGWQLQPAQITEQLRTMEPALLDLNRWYRTARHIETHAYYETEKTCLVQVVDPASADPGAPGGSVLSAPGKNHNTICKLSGAKDPMFVTVASKIEKIRARVRMGRDDPVMREAIRERLVDSEYPQCIDMRDFEDLPPNLQPKVELVLREGFRDIFRESPPDVTTLRLLGNSNFNVDRYALSLWLEVVGREDLENLLLHIRKAAAKVYAARTAGDPEPASLIPLFRAATTLEHVLAKQPYDNHRTLLAIALKTVGKEQGTNANQADVEETQEVLTRLLKLVEGFAKAKAEAFGFGD